MTKKTLFLLILAAAGLITFAKYNDMKQSHLSRSVSENLLTFDLQAVNEAVILNKGKEFRFVQVSEGKWKCITSHDYPAKTSFLNELILKLYDLESSQKLTSKKENHAAFGLDASRSVITLKDKEGKNLCVLELGKQRESVHQKSAADVFRYAKSGTSDSVYLVSLDFEMPEASSDWLQKVILNLPKKEIYKISLLTTKPEVTLLKKEKEEEAFELKGLKPEETVKPWMINQLSGTFEGLAFSDVMTSKAAEELELTFTETAQVTTTEGFLYRFSLAKQKEKFFLRLFAEVINLPAEPDKAKALQEKASKLNEEFSKWVYELDSYDAANFTKSYKDFIEEKKDSKLAPIPEELQGTSSQELSTADISGIMGNPEERQDIQN